MPIFRRNHEFDHLERELRALRSEPSKAFLGKLAGQIGGSPRWVASKPRLALVAVLAVAVLGAMLSANVTGVVGSGANGALHAAENLTGLDAPRSLQGGPPPPPPGQTPAQDQYADECGVAPAAQCIVEVDPDHPSVAPGDSVTFDLILQTAGHKSGVTSDTTFSVNWTTQDGTAHSGTDFPPQSGTVTFTPGDSVLHVTITTFASSGGGTFSVVWTPTSAAAVMDGDDHSNTITITSGGPGGPPPPPQPKVKVDPGNQTVTEGNSGTKTVTYHVSLDKPATGTTTVTYSTADGTATSPSDYVATSGTITFNTGDKGPVDVTVTINGDTTKEPDEKFTLNFSVSGPATIDPPAATKTITIKNDDGP